ncbi:hypothetical protein TNCT_627511 [Trichonephila clavata]|uniref:Uncharacterized protein n=1 Tax=Trichonephila clavata TaxID=2740835 RepID=A0A8X6KY38_TRICU|nr:hypothetical protein TNCT_627511 [Trichonephila clavata]
MSRNVPDKVILDGSSPGEKMELTFIPSTEQKLLFGGNGVLVCGSIILTCGYSTYFDAGTVNSWRYRYEILDAFPSFFLVLRARTTILWVVMRTHIECTLFIKLMKKWIFNV